MPTSPSAAIPAVPDIHRALADLARRLREAGPSDRPPERTELVLETTPEIAATITRGIARFRELHGLDDRVEDAAVLARICAGGR